MQSQNGQPPKFQCVGSYYPGLDRFLGYIEARIYVYLKNYAEGVRKQKKYWQLLEKVKAGTKILIIEVDGPHQELLEYYKEKYGVGDDFIVGNTMLANKKNIEIMLNDTTKSWGHGYALCVLLLQDLGMW